MLGWARRRANLSSPPSLTLLRGRVADEELCGLQHDLFQSAWDFAQRMRSVETVVRALDEPERADALRQRVEMLRFGTGHGLVASSMNNQPRHFDPSRRALDVELGLSVELDIVQQVR